MHLPVRERKAFMDIANDEGALGDGDDDDDGVCRAVKERRGNDPLLGVDNMLGDVRWKLEDLLPQMLAEANWIIGLCGRKIIYFNYSWAEKDNFKVIVISIAWPKLNQCDSKSKSKSSVLLLHLKEAFIRILFPIPLSFLLMSSSQFNTDGYLNCVPSLYL